MDLTLKHFYRVVLLHAFTASVLLELTHLIHPTDNLLLGDTTMVLVHHRWLLLASAAWAAIFWLVYNFDSGDVCAVTLIILEPIADILHPEQDDAKEVALVRQPQHLQMNVDETRGVEVLLFE